LQWQCSSVPAASKIIESHRNQEGIMCIMDADEAAAQALLTMSLSPQPAALQHKKRGQQLWGRFQSTASRQPFGLKNNRADAQIRVCKSLQQNNGPSLEISNVKSCQPTNLRHHELTNTFTGPAYPGRLRNNVQK
jgi:hypothetical protein